MNDWQPLKVKDLGQVVTGRTPPSEVPGMFGEGAPFITPTDIEDCNRYVRTDRRLSPDGERFLVRAILPERAVCFVCIGATIGKMCMTDRVSATNQQINAIIVDERRHVPEFVYYLLRSKIDEIRARAGGAATPIVNKTSFSDVDILAPPASAQRRITAILGAYDDLIQVNRRRTALLEEMAQRLFDEWFVNFRFPGYNGAESVDMLPEGWRRGPISTLYDGLYDGPHATPPPAKNGPIFLGIGNITDSGRLDLSSVRHIAECDFAAWTRRVTPQEGDIVFTYEATLNRYALIGKNFRGCLGRRLALIRARSVIGANLYLYLYFFSKDWREVIIRNTLSGATVDRVPLSRFPEFPIMLPSTVLLGKFHDFVKPIFDQLEMIDQTNRNLMMQRDLLLPKLVTGELSVDVAENELGAAA